MAEARRDEEVEQQRRDVRDVRTRTQTSDHPDRFKSDSLLCSHKPLSSIRAAIKRTRSASQSEQTRDRRRPEITIVSAEPLDNNNWFPGSSGVLSPPPQSSWSSGIQPLSQSPPSYDQVIQEKTQEETNVVKPTAAPRRATSSTQTDPEKEDTADTATAVPQCSAATQSAEKRSGGKKPQKPPRPSLPKPTDGPEQQSGSESDVKLLNQRSDPGPTHTRSVTVYWDIPTNHLSTSSSNSEPSRRPVPLPRIKSRKQTHAEEVIVESVDNLSENSNTVHTDPEETSSNKYLKELLEVFSSGNECEDDSDGVNQSDDVCQGEDAVDEMNMNNQRNIRARIQAFESQVTAEEGNVVEQDKPEPRPRKTTIRPPVAAKPSVAAKPQFNHSTDDDNQNILFTNLPQNHTPDPRPLPPRKPAGMSIKEELETLHSNGAMMPNRPRPVFTRADSVCEEEPSPVPPVPPAKPFKQPLKPNLNINNHNSASMVNDGFADNSSHHVPSKPQRNVDSNGSSFPRQNITRRPTTIRVPSKPGSFSDTSQDAPPPLPVQKPVGSLNSSVHNKQNPTRALSLPESYQPGPELSLPPRRQTTNKPLPPRPPSAKTGPGRPPPPSLQATGRSVSASASWDASPKPPAKKPQRKRPVLPPRPNPGHRLYNKYTLQLPHGIAASDYNGSNTGELSFQKNEVLLLLEEIDRNTFECQVGDMRGRVHKSRMKVITPLVSDDWSPPQREAASADAHGQKVQVIHDFTPEGPGELGLRAGDIVTMVEQVDGDWYRGTCRGSTGFFPVNYVKILSDSPKTLPEKKPKPKSVKQTKTTCNSGPRCVARFDFDGEHSNELSFCEGDVIQLKEYIGQEWARGQIGVLVGIFPLNFVDVVEDLPPPPSQQQTQPNRVALPGMAASPSVNPEAAKPAQASQSKVEWAVALYDYSGKSEDDLSFLQGDRILITQHINAEWSCGRLNGREGMFPSAFVESASGQQSSNNQQVVEAAEGQTARALYSFTSDSEEELSLQVGDVITNLESVDDEWFLGDLRGRRALVPKNYVQVLG